MTTVQSPSYVEIIGTGLVCDTLELALRRDMDDHNMNITLTQSHFFRKLLMLSRFTMLKDWQWDEDSYYKNILNMKRNISDDEDDENAGLPKPFDVITTEMTPTGGGGNDENTTEMEIERIIRINDIDRHEFSACILYNRPWTFIASMLANNNEFVQILSKLVLYLNNGTRNGSNGGNINNSIVLNENESRINQRFHNVSNELVGDY